MDNDTKEILRTALETLRSLAVYMRRQHGWITARCHPIP